MKKFARRITLSYILADFAGSAVAWGLFYLFRKYYIETPLYGEYFRMELGNKFYLGISLIPLFFIFVFAMAGFYSDPLRRSRLLEFGKSLVITLALLVVLFFALILDDVVGHYSTYYSSFIVLFLLVFLLTWIPRFVITSHVSGKIHRREAGFRTLVIGSHGKALRLIDEIRNEKMPAGNLITGYISVGSPAGRQQAGELPDGQLLAGEQHSGQLLAGEQLSGQLTAGYQVSGQLLARDRPAGSPIEGERLAGEVPWLGTVEDILNVIESHDIDEVILAMEEGEYHVVESIVNTICYRDVLVKAVPSMRQVIAGHVEAGPIYATPLLRVSYREMPHWQQMIKQTLDYSLSALALVILSPLMLALALLIRLSGKGEVIFRQERIGRYGKPFMIYKFRSMEDDAELNGPQLAVMGDTRITPLGRFMRKHRFDEIPNFINVLRGEMSLVGPRPERRHYIEKIEEKAPYYNRILAVKPGITCWGQVKLGYASDIGKMLERLDYDLLYLENVSLYLDLKIIFYTLGTIIKGKGL
ncbi:MAG: sugar transferase [Bacteroidales bacterium]|nr:sugar transferase [Bacteroidales bacterium]